MSNKKTILSPPAATETAPLTNDVVSDEKFIKFLIADLFTDGIQVWWFIGLFSIIVVAFIFITFFANLIDNHYLLADHNQDQFAENSDWQRRFPMPLPQLERLMEARHRLGNPSLPSLIRSRPH